MRVLVCGDRNYGSKAGEHDRMAEVLNEHKIDVLIAGEARGADTIAKDYAHGGNIKYEGYPADWNKYGKGAGPIRNKQMLVEGKPDLVVAFLAENSKGTANMIRQATDAGVTVQVINV